MEPAMCRSISEEIRQSFRVFHETFHRGYQELEGNVLKKVEELESRIETLEMMAEGRSNPNAQMKPKPKGAESCVSVSSVARVLHGDIRPGDVTHEKVKQSFVEFFSNARRISASRYYNDISRPFLQHISCYLLQVSYDFCRDYLIDCLVSELLFQSVGKKSEETSLVNSKMKETLRAFTLLSKTSLNVEELQSAMNDKVKGADILKKEMLKVFLVQIDDPSINTDEEQWRNRTAAFGILLNLVMHNHRNQPIEYIKQKILDSFKTKKLTFPPEMTQLLSDCLCLCWDMVTLNPPMIVDEPTKIDESWHDVRGVSKVENIPLDLYYRPVLFFSAKLDVAVKAQIGCSKKK